MLLYMCDLASTLLFSVEGARIAYDEHRDPIVVALAGIFTAVGGGTMRDALMERAPFYVANPEYMLVAIVGLIAAMHPSIVSIAAMLQPISLIVFSFVGALTAHMHGHIVAMPAAALLTAIGGGMLRDAILCRRIDVSNVLLHIMMMCMCTICVILMFTG